MERRVWYAAFGSNLSYERFLVYLNGGQAPGSLGASPGARDNTAPLRSTTCFTTRRLVFGHQSVRWSGGGVAFLDSQPGDQSSEIRTALRLYDITTEQFEDVFQQENGLEEPIAIDLDEVESKGWADLTDRWYGRVLFLGRDDGLPIVTITASKLPDPNPPHPAYLQTIVTGLTTTIGGASFGFSDVAQAKANLVQADGIDDSSGPDDPLWAGIGTYPNE